MKIRLNKTIGIILLVIGALDVLLLLLVDVSAGTIDFSNLFISFFVILIAIAYMRGAYFEVSENTLTILNLMGKKAQEFTFADKSAFELKGKNVFFTRDGNKKLKLYAFTADPTDWAAFLEWINQ